MGDAGPVVDEALNPFVEPVERWDIRGAVDPFPYVVVDGMMNDISLNAFRRNWPGRGYFMPEIPGNFVCSIHPFVYEGTGCWGTFMYGMAPNMIIGLLMFFSDYLERRFPGERNYYVSNCSLMQSMGDYGGHDVHTHHYHDPEWVMTVLLYIDEDANGHNGTTILRAKSGLDQAEVSAQTLNWHDMTEEVETVEYKRGRVLAFYETPISFHAVNPLKAKALFGRRILRFHVSVPVNHCKRLYGTDLEGYQKKMAKPSKDEEAIGWMRSDLELLRGTKLAMTTIERDAWGRGISLGVPARKEIPGP